MIKNIENFVKATRYLEDNRYDKALSFFKKQLRHHGGFKECYLNMGNCLQNMGDRTAAYNYYLTAGDSAVAFSDGTHGPFEDALNNIGLLEYGYEHDDLAIELYQKVLSINPNNYDARWNLGITTLRQHISGKVVDVNTAWVNYDFRFYQTGKNRARADSTIPRWCGKLGGRSIIVLAEQGLGDKFQWLRYVKVLETMFDKVWVQLPKTLHSTFSNFNVVEHVSDTDAEVSIPLCSLTRYININAAPCDYLVKPAAFKFGGTSLNIGVCGEGSLTHVNNRHRSCGLSRFDVLQEPGIKLFNVSNNTSCTKHITALNPKTWTETSSYLLGLDLLITVDTSVAHLAGALGVPCWILMPCWDTDFRWGDSTCGSNNVWYPKSVIFRNPQSWDLLFKNVKECLQSVKNY